MHKYIKWKNLYEYIHHICKKIGFFGKYSVAKIVVVVIFII